jgi:site-specific DNA-methyltransferase (adenine-specific)
MQLLLGDCREQLKLLADNSVDAIITDPPYELNFMNRAWDNSGIAYDQVVWTECLRVLKPGGHVLAFGGSRTYHRLATAIEDAGFEIRDQIQWVYASGMPKSLDVSKALDKQAGEVREVIGRDESKWRNADNYKGEKYSAMRASDYETKATITAPASDLAKQWDGWGTALKPANEPIVLARKPLIGTVATNVATWGTGALNINATRVGSEVRVNEGMSSLGVMHDDAWKPNKVSSTVSGRWPANIIFDEEAGALLDEQSGTSSSKQTTGKRTGKTAGILGAYVGQDSVTMGHTDSGGASRFFFCPKASKKERDEGLEDFEGRYVAASNQAQAELARGHTDFNDEGLNNVQFRKNYHPTVKPVALMRYLVRLVTPPNGIVLDPFMGSGTTGCAVVLEDKQFIGIERDESYMPIAEKRIQYFLDKQK